MMGVEFDEAEQKRVAMMAAGRVSHTSLAVAALAAPQFEQLSKRSQNAISDAIAYCMRVCFHKVAYAQKMTRRRIVNNGFLGGVSQFILPQKSLRPVYIRHSGAMLLLNVGEESPRAATMRQVYGR